MESEITDRTNSGKDDHSRVWLDEHGLPVTEDLEADNKQRRRCELAIHHMDLSYSARVLCRIVLGRLEATGYPDWCTSGIEGLGRDAGLKKTQLYEAMAEAKREGIFLRRREGDYLRTSVYVPHAEEVDAWIKKLWYDTKAGPDLRKWREEVETHSFGHAPDDPNYLPPLVDRLEWSRVVRDLEGWRTTTKAVAFGVDCLLRRKTGIVARLTTRREIEDLSGCGRDVVTRELRWLQEHGWLDRRDVTGKGMHLRAILPHEIQNRVREEYVERHA